MIKKTNMTLLLRMREDMRALIRTEATREDNDRKLNNVGYMYAISDSLDNLFRDLQGWELKIPAIVLLEEISFPIIEE
jgi:hypothetical protein